MTILEGKWIIDNRGMPTAKSKGHIKQNIFMPRPWGALVISFKFRQNGWAFLQGSRAG